MMIYINFKITSNQHIEHVFNKPTKTEIKDFITSKIGGQFSPPPVDEEEPATIYKQSLNKLINNLTKCYVELVHDTDYSP